MKKIKVMSVFGTRPEAIKMAPLVLELQKHENIESIVCVTAQHREMLDSVIEIFSLKPDYDLDIMEPGQTLTSITTKTITGMDRMLDDVKPDILLVHGDTSTAFAGALAGFYHKIPVGHVEAGLRTGDRYSPYPEEVNRRLISEIAELHFSPTVANADNLKRESVAGEIFITGNTVIDALNTTVSTDFKFTSPGLEDIDFDSKRIVLVTAHRRENYGEPFENMMGALKDIVLNHEDVEIIYPVHMSPVVREVAGRLLGDVPRVRLIEPINVDEMHNLMDRCYLVMTDSGGIQEEAPALGKPVLVMRKETERPEAVEAGTVKLCGVDKDTIIAMASDLLNSEAEYRKMANAVNPYGNGTACIKITEAILWHFGLGPKPDDFIGGKQR